MSAPAKTVQQAPACPVSEIPDRAQMLRIIAEAVAGGLPAPMTMELFLHDTGIRSLVLRMDNNRAVDVDAWVPAVSPDGEEKARLGRTLFEDTDHDWRSYSHDTSWHGWKLHIWSSVDQPTYPAPGSAIPNQAGYVVGECEHRVAFSEWAAGLRTCERCPKPAADDDSKAAV